MSKAKFVEVTFRCYNDAGGFGPKQHHYEATVFVTDRTQIRLRLREGFAKDMKPVETAGAGVTVTVDGVCYTPIENYNTVYAKVTEALNQVL
jgi:hypothetical protein